VSQLQPDWSLELITNGGLVRAFTEKRKPKWIPSKL
jgi:hypothetical protein